MASTRLVLAAVCSSLLLGCQSVPDAAAAVRTLIDADNRADLDAALACYADDAVWLPPDAETVAGKPAIAERYRELFAAWAPRLAVEIVEQELDDLRAYVRGQTRGELVPRGGGAAVAVHDRFTAILRHDGRRWLVLQLAWEPVADRGR